MTKTPVAVATRATRSKTPVAAEKTPKKTSSGTAKKTSSASKKPSSKKPSSKKPSSARGAEVSGSGPRGASSPPAAARRPRVALSGFGSADLTKYGATATRLGASLCAGHAWDPRATHVVFGPRGSRSIKFLAAAASGVPLLDASFLDASRRAGALLGPETFGDHLWRGGWRGADAGLVAPDAAKRWLSRRQKAQARGSGEDARPFAGLVVAVAPFPSSNRIERDMLVEVLRAGGARVSTVSAKGALIRGARAGRRRRRPGVLRRPTPPPAARAPPPPPPRAARASLPSSSRAGSRPGASLAQHVTPRRGGRRARRRARAHVRRGRRGGGRRGGAAGAAVDVARRGASPRGEARASGEGGRGGGERSRWWFRDQARVREGPRGADCGQEAQGPRAA